MKSNLLISLRKSFAVYLTMFAALFVTLGSATAQELSPEHIALARKYVEITDTSKIYEATILRSGVNTLQTIIPQNPEISDEVNAAISLTIQDYAKRKGELMDQFARVYAIRFSIEELNEILAFYESPVGKRLTAQNPSINEDLGVVMGVFQNNLKSEFYAKVKAELQSKGIEF